MFLLRDARLSDVPSLLRLAEGFDTLNLPHDAQALTERVEVSEQSFRHALPRTARHYLFVLEDTAHSAIVGTSQIAAQHGTREAPHVYFDVLSEEHYSESLDRLFKHQVLRLGFDHDGPTELGGLVLRKDLRGHPARLGRRLSFVRFLFIAARRHVFRDHLIAELLPPFLPDGNAPLWAALGQRFTGMNYRDADRLSQQDKRFIRALFPRGMIYTTLFDDSAREVIGEVGPGAKGVERMLRQVGFRPLNTVDPFDGGPHVGAPTDSVTAVSGSRRIRLVAEKPPGAAACSGLLAHDGGPKTAAAAGDVFRACPVQAWRADDAVFVDETTRDLLQVEPGASLWFLDDELPARPTL